MGKRLNFGLYSKGAGGMVFEEYVLNALNRIERWSYDVTTRFDEADAATTTYLLLLETGDYLKKESGTFLSTEDA